mmetsp:Transcript_33945/g.70007  ORF Transcript_33945/g.70007 Transcript_33945/m.70007 type:complete len:167 (-) Transcript_33945:108-608(-)
MRATADLWRVKAAPLRHTRRTTAPRRTSRKESAWRHWGFVDGGYVDGQIQVSRALGNISQTGQKVPGIICTPDVSVVSIQDTTEFVLLATDGVWDAIREQLAVTTARKVLRETRSPEAAAKAVLEAAGKASKADNSAVIVLSFNMPEPLPKRDSEQRRFQFSSKKE